LLHAGEVSLVDKHGISFPVEPGQYYDLPLVISGRRMGVDSLALARFEQIRRISNSLGNSFFSQISQIDLSEPETVKLIFRSGPAVYLIGSAEIPDRLVHLKRLREKLQEDNREPVRVDLRYRSLAFVSMQ